MDRKRIFSQFLILSILVIILLPIRVFAENSINAKRFLFQSTFGEKQQKISELEEIGVDEWFQRQYNSPITSHIELYDYYFSKLSSADKPYSRNQAWLHATLNGQDQLRQRMAFALSQIFVVSRQHDVLSDHERALASYYDLLSQHALGNYRELLIEVAKHPAMGRYLDMMFSQKAIPEESIKPNENFAREIMQLMTIGPVLLNMDGSTIKDNSGEPILAYDEQDVPEVARILSGWGMTDASSWGVMDGDWFQPMTPSENYHDRESKYVLNTHFPSGRSAQQDLEQLVDTLLSHPNAAPFVSFRLIQRFTTSNPSPEYIERVANVFVDNGDGVTGDLYSVIQAILMDSENVEGRATKFKEPLIAVVNFIRISRKEETASSPRDFYPSVSLAKYHDNWIQLPLNSATVFNFYQPTDAPKGIIADNGLYSPEQTLMLGDNYKYVMDRMNGLITNSNFDLNREYECNGSWNRGTPTENDLKLALQFLSTQAMSKEFYDGYHYLHNEYGHNPRARCGSFKFFIASSPEFWVIE
ncbi:TPA: DUF1800 family protein [Vibrio vulnificus]|nr:DUF1800 domain-containing protein [Vibrio vulnificus]HAS6061861.1 DUF1800 family protein [Vibrio vulnificus]